MTSLKRVDNLDEVCWEYPGLDPRGWPFGDCRRDTHERGSHVGQGVGAAETRPRGGVLRPTGGGVRQEGARVGEVTRHQIYLF